MTHTVLAIRKDYRFLSVWCSKHHYSQSAVNDVINKRGYYKEMAVPNNWSQAYKIMQNLIKDGYSESLKYDGWDVSLIDLYFSKPTINPVKKLSFEDMCWAVCEMGDEYTCNVFLSPTPDAGPKAVLFMMEHNARATKSACDFLNQLYKEYTFCVESSDVITIWAI